MLFSEARWLLGGRMHQNRAILCGCGGESSVGHYKIARFSVVTAASHHQDTKEWAQNDHTHTHTLGPKMISHTHFYYLGISFSIAPDICYTGLGDRNYSV